MSAEEKKLYFLFTHSAKGMQLLQDMRNITLSSILRGSLILTVEYLGDGFLLYWHFYFSTREGEKNVSPLFTSFLPYILTTIHPIQSVIAKYGG